jgi:hypothetical protein
LPRRYLPNPSAMTGHLEIAPDRID